MNELKQKILLCLCVIIVFLLFYITTLKVGTYFIESDIIFQKLLILLGILSFFNVIFYKRKKELHLIDIMMVLWFGYVILNYIFISPYPAEKNFINICTTFILYAELRLLCVGCNKLRKYIILILAFYGLYEAGFGLLQLYGFKSSNHNLFRITSTLFNPEPYSAYLVIILSICCDYVYRRKSLYNNRKIINNDKYNSSLEKIVYLACYVAIPIMVIALVATLSMAALVALLIVAVTIFYKRYKMVLLPMLIILPIVGVILYLFKHDSANGRVLMWIISSIIIKNNLFLGIGIGGYQHGYSLAQMEFFSNNPKSSFINVAGSPEYAFNDFLFIGSEQGLVGLFFFSFIILLSLYSLFKYNNELGFGLLALLIVSMFSYPFYLLPFRIIGIVLIVVSASYPLSVKWRGHLIKLKSYKFRLGYKISMITIVIVIAIFIFFRIDKKAEAYKEFKNYKHSGEVYIGNKRLEWVNVIDDSPEFMFDFGKSLNIQGKYNDSNAILSKGVMISNDNMFYIVIGNNFMELGCYELAEKAYKTAHVMEPRKLFPLYLLLLLYEKWEKDNEGIKVANKILEYKSKNIFTTTLEMKEYAKKYLESTN